MPAFRDLGTDVIPPEQARPVKQLTYCNWVQALEGNIDTSHISWLHQWHALMDTPDDGSDRPGYPTNPKSWYIWSQARAPRLEVEDTEYGFKYVGIRTTPNGHTHVRMTQYIIPYQTIVAGLPVRAGGTTFVPIDDEHCWRYSVQSGMLRNQRGASPATDYNAMPYKYPYGNVMGPVGAGKNGVVDRQFRPDNDYLIDRDGQRDKLFTGIENFVSQDLMATESMGPIYDRTQEHLGNTDKAIIRMRRFLIKTAQDLAQGIEPPATKPSPEMSRIYSAEKILAPGEDWRKLGTPDDPMVRELEAHPLEAPTAIGGGS
jgi:phthalate 4,5-dioxygenase